jgi:Na+/H+-dicarboxylate symporter
VPDPAIATRRPKQVTLPALIALVAGFALGAVARETNVPWLLAISSVAKPVGMLWTNALRMIVLPMMIAYLVLAINSVPRGKTAGKLGGTTLLFFIILLGFAGVVAVTLTPLLITILPVGHAELSSFAANASSTAEAVKQGGSAPSFAEWVTTLIPTNTLRAVVEENYLAVVISAVLFAAAMTQITTERRALLVGFFHAVADTAGILVGWLVSVLPVAAFALAFSSGAERGLTLAGSVGVVIAALSVLLVALTLLMYPLAVIVGRVSLRRFAAAVAPAQTVGAGTRSSLACLPALLEGAERGLGMQPEVAGFVLPLSVSTFKLNLALSQPFKLLFIASMFGLHLTPAFVLTFTATIILLSFTTAGIPSGGAFVSLPLYIAAGIPVEAVVLFKVADAVPDIFKTVLNVTADMTVATIVARFMSEKSPARERLVETNRLTAEG